MATINYNQPPKNILVEMANADNAATNANTHPSDVDITNVVAVDPIQFQGRNTSFKMSPAFGGSSVPGAIGAITFYYKRRSAMSFFNGEIVVQAPYETVNTVLDLIAYINAGYNIQIPMEYVNLTLSTWDPVTKTGSLAFDNDVSWIWVDAVPFRVYGIGEYLDRDLEEMYPDGDLEPFTLPPFTPPTP